jgi:uncharacterized protein (DUF2141 family)
MSLSDPILNRRIAVAWIALIAAASVVYLSGISHELIWYDEAVSIAIAKHRFSEILALMPNENHPPLHYLLLRVMILLFGSSEWALRLLSVIAAVGLVGLGAGPIRRLVGNRTAFTYAAVVLFIPAVLIYAHETRMYSLANLAVTATVLYGLLAARDGRTSDWVAFGLWTLAAAYLHYYGLIAAAMAHLFVFAWILFRNRERLKRYLVTAAIVLAGYLPWLLVLVSQTLRVNKTGFWIPPVSWQSVFAAIFRPFTYRELFPMFPVVRPWMLIAMILSFILIIVGLVLARRRRAQNEFTFSMMLLFVYLGTMATAIVISLFSVPIFYNRYMVVCMGILALLVALGIGQIRIRGLSGGALIVLAILNSFTIRDIYTRQFNLPFKQVKQALEQEIKPGDLVITSDCFSVGPVFHYFPQVEHYYSSNSFEASQDAILKVMVPPLHYNKGLKELLSARKTFWAVTDSAGLSRNTYDILEDSPGWEPVGEPRTFSEPVPFSFISFTITKFAYTGRKGPIAEKGKIRIHVTGLKPGGHLYTIIDTRMPIPGTLPFRFLRYDISSDHLDAVFNDLPYGQYVIGLWHDENKNGQVDQKNGMPAEGSWFANMEKIDRKLGLQGFTFEALKFSFHEAERTFDAKMLYPPFTIQ